MSDLTPEALDELERLHKAATPGNWRSTWCDTTEDDADHGLDITIATDEPGRVGFRRGVVSVFDFNGKYAGCTEPDADAIVAFHNAAPTLIAAAREAAELRARLEVAKRELAGACTTIAADRQLRIIAAREAGLSTDEESPTWDAICEVHIVRAHLERDEALAEVKRLRAALGMGDV